MNARPTNYDALIQQTVVNYWSRPPSARNGMEALLSIQLIPTGEVVSVSVLKSSGNGAFDRSAINAVEKAGSFPELKNLPPREFERTFRRFRLQLVEHLEDPGERRTRGRRRVLRIEGHHHQAVGGLRGRAGELEAELGAHLAALLRQGRPGRCPELQRDHEETHHPPVKPRPLALVKRCVEVAG